jgi:hypothetical protein
MKANGGVDIILTLALAGGELSASRPCRLHPGERAPGTHWIGGWVDPRVGLDDVEKRRFLPLQGLELRPLCRLASHCTDYAIPAPFCEVANSFKILSRVSQWLRRGSGSVNRFIGSPLVVTTISSYTLTITVTIAHVTSHTKSSSSSSLGTSELKRSHFPFPYSLASSRHGPRTENTDVCCVAQTTQKTSHMITISPVHWRADCYLATRYKHSSYCCVRVERGVF